MQKKSFAEWKKFFKSNTFRVGVTNEGGILEVKKVLRGVYDPNDYENIYRLVTHCDLGKSSMVVLQLAVYAVYVVHLLKITHFKGVDVTEEFEANLGSVVLRHLQSSVLNGFQVHEVVEKQPGFEIEFHEIGSGIYPTFSFMNSSCNYNVIRVRFGDTLVGFALQPIKAGDEITCAYGPSFPLAPKIERQRALEVRGG